MTLIITTLRPRDIVITSDSRATLRTNGVVTGHQDTCQKIFPVPDHPLVISHHGENNLADKPLGEFLGDFFSRLNPGNLTVLQLADELRAYVHPAARARLRPTSHNGIGFIVAGFGADDRGPSAAEVFWKCQDRVLITEERQWLPTAVIPSGGGTAQASPVDWRHVDGVTLDQVRAYNEHLIDEAASAKVTPNSVGGPDQEIIITRQKWEWTLKPPKTAPPT